MMPTEKVLDRIEQSFLLFKVWFKLLVIPFFIYYLISFVFTSIILVYIWFSWVLDSFMGDWSSNILVNLFSSSKVVLIATLFIFFLIIYLTIYVPFIVYSIRVIWNIYNKKPIWDFKTNFIFALSRFSGVMKTYWYIFAYVALIPSFFFILWGWIFNISYFMNLDSSIKFIWWTFMVIWILLFIVFALYRWLKTTFSLYSAIDNDDYTKENFNSSIKITKNKWRRILWNLMFVWIIVSLLSWVASNFISLFFASSSWYTELLSSFWSWSSFDLSSLSSSVWKAVSDFSFFNYIVSGFFQLFISTVWKIFIIIFIYVFYKRLTFETTNISDNTEVKQEKIVELEEKTLEL